MAISRGQMQRELYTNGGIRSLVPRQHYGLGSIFKGVKKAVKGVAKGIGKIASSDLGKIALLAAAGGYPYMSGSAGIGGGWFGSGSALGKLGGILKTQNIMKNIGEGFSGVNKLVGKIPGSWGTVASVGGGLLAGVMAKKPEETESEYRERINKVKPYLRQYMTAAFKGTKSPEEIEELIETNTSEYRVADGGLISRKGFAFGTNGNDWHQGDWTDPNDPDYEPNPQKLTGDIEILQSLLKEFIEVHKRYPRDMEELKSWAVQKTQGGVTEEVSTSVAEIIPEKQKGGRIGYAFGQTQEGIGNIPTRQNSAGVTELDFRDNGGFVPPIGIKEKADDIPAMVSNNEFVMTADAVKGMGGGSVERGSQRMYDMMKQLEGKVINA